MTIRRTRLVHLDYTLRASGETFSPTAAEARSGIQFSAKGEPGETATTGRYRGQPRPYGWAELRSPSDVDGGPGAPFLQAASALVAASTAFGASECTLHIDVAFREQCNFEMSCAAIVGLAKLGLPVTVSCFQDEAE